MGGIPDLEFRELPPATAGWSALSDSTRKGIWKYRPVLCVAASVEDLSLGEGNTPIVRLNRWGSEQGLQRVFAKLEYMAPTGSFKDRGAAAVIATLAAQGVSTIVEDSSGNAGAAMAAYAARAGLRAQIFVPESAPLAKRSQIAGYGAEVVAVRGSREDVAAAARVAADVGDVAYASHARHPAFVEGTKTFGFEMASEMRDDPPGHVIFPVGNGGLLLGVWKAYHELEAAGFDAPLPKLHAVQARACAPLAAAFEAQQSSPLPITPVPTRAGGVAVDRPARGSEVLSAVRVSRGSALSVTDDETQIARVDLARLEGLDLEFTTAVAFAAVRRLRRAGVIKASELVVIAATGSGLKDPPG
jgi:threonine synthase